MKLKDREVRTKRDGGVGGNGIPSELDQIGIYSEVLRPNAVSSLVQSIELDKLEERGESLGKDLVP